MCGIAGFVDPSQQNLDAVALAMAQAILHRGPDDGGVWSERAFGVGFGFRRLAILDLSPEGHQPMSSRTGRFVILFNGEIYNYRELKDDLRNLGHQFRGGSDTEVILAGCEQWGAEKIIPRLNGMFAIAIWDRAENQLTLARDRLGKKPLYYGWSNGAFLFGSELKALRANPAFSGEISNQASALFFKRGYIPAPHSIFKSYYKLIQGSYLTLSVSQLSSPPNNFCPNPYWSNSGVSPNLYWDLRKLKDKFETNLGSELEVLRQLEELLQDSVKRRMMADVPLGAFLSGGVDSSLVVALMQRSTSTPVQTFSIGFQEPQYNEADKAREVAVHLGTDHTELYVSIDDGLALIPRLPELFDEPLADASQIPTYLVSRLARDEVTVALTGDGGDEMFVGYNRYIWPQKLFNKMGWMPPGVRGGVGTALELLPNSILSALAKGASSFLPPSMRPRRPHESVAKLARGLREKSAESLYDQLTSYWQDEEIRGELPNELFANGEVDGVSSFIDRTMLLDLSGYLPEDLLAKVDRASMAVSLETRCPLLDYRVVEFAASIPASLRAKDGGKKYLLRTLLRRFLPETLVERPKMGFSVPIGYWLKGSLREWAQELLKKLETSDILDKAKLNERWNDHLSGAANWQNELWTALMYQAWLEKYR